MQQIQLPMMCNNISVVGYMQNVMPKRQTTLIVILIAIEIDDTSRVISDIELLNVVKCGLDKREDTE